MGHTGGSIDRTTTIARQKVGSIASRLQRKSALIDVNRIMGSKSALLRMLVAASSAKNGGFWRAQFCTEVAQHSE
jgi:hypothetical protein